MLVPSAVAAAALLIAGALLLPDAVPVATPSITSPSRSPAPGTADEQLVAERLGELPPSLLPYPFTTPTPAPVPTEIDGTYLLILTLDDLGGDPSHVLPFPCVRCLPYAREPGISTLIFFDGVYFVDHQISGFHSKGHYEVDGNTLTLFNDANCTGVRGTYRWQLEAGSLRLEAVDDTCAYEGERPFDLASNVWTKIPVCTREVAHLWPGILGC
jgi:hypothetical protein